MKIELAISKRFRDVQVSKIRGKLRKFSHQEFFFKNNMPQKKNFSVRKLRNLNRNSSNLSSGMQSQQNKAERRVNWSAKTLHFLSLLRFADKRKSEKRGRELKEKLKASLQSDFTLIQRDLIKRCFNIQYSTLLERLCASFVKPPTQVSRNLVSNNLGPALGS